MEKKISLLLFLLVFSSKILAHGAQGLSDGGLDGQFSSTSAVHSPVQINIDGSIHFGYHFPGLDFGTINDQGNYHHDAPFSVQIVPTIIYGWDSVKRFISLDERTEPLTSNAIPLANNQKGYKYIKLTSLAGGLGADLEVGLPIGSLGAGVGLAPLVGGLWYRERKVDNLHDVKSLPPMVAPKNLSDLSLWKTGDRMSFGVTGGITANLFVGIDPVLTFGPRVVVTGSWLVRLKKVGETKLFASLSKLKLKSIGTTLDATMASIGLEHFKTTAKRLGFVFDLREVHALTALKSLYKGDLSLAQELMARHVNGVERGTVIQTTTNGLRTNRGFHIPFLFSVERDWEKVHTTGLEHDHDHKSSKNFFLSHTGTVDSTSGVFSKHRKELKQFFAHFKESKSIEKESPEIDFGGTYKWMFERDKIKEKLLFKKLRKLVKSTGLTSLLDLNFPTTKLGYVRSEFEVFFSKEDTMELMGMGRELGNDAFSRANKNLRPLIEKTFAQQGHRNFCKVLGYLKCFKKILKESRNSIEKMKTYSQKAFANYEQKSWKKFTQEYAKVGKYLLKNPFVFQSVLKELPNVKMIMKFEGEKIPSLRRVIKL